GAQLQPAEHAFALRRARSWQQRRRERGELPGKRRGRGHARARERLERGDKLRIRAERLRRRGLGGKGLAALHRGGERGRREREPHGAIVARGGLFALLDRGQAVGQRFEFAAIDRGGRFLRQLGNLRGAGVGAHARLAANGERLVAAAAENAHGL